MSTSSDIHEATSGSRENRLASRWSPPREVPLPERTDGSKPQAISLEEARSAVEKAIRAHFENRARGVLLIVAPPGVGKSHAAAKVGREVCEREDGDGPSDKVPNKKLCVAWFGTRHDQYDSVFRPLGGIHVYGRRAGLDGQPGNCCHAAVANELAKKGWPVQDLLCSPNSDSSQPSDSRRCSIGRNNCEYWKQFEGIAHRFFPKEHLRIPSLWVRPDCKLLVVLDEGDAGHFMHEPVQLAEKSIRDWMMYRPDTKVLLEPVWSLLKSKQRPKYLADAALYEELDKLVPADVRPFTRLVLPAAPEEGALKAWVDHLPDGRVQMFVETLLSELQRYRAGERFVSRITICNSKLLLHPKPNIPRDFGKLTTVLLNASPDHMALQTILPSGIRLEQQEVNVALHPDTTVTYVVGNSFSKSSIRKDKSLRKRWIRLLREFAARGQRVLIVATRYGENIIKGELSSLSNVRTAHYGALTGLNDYSDCDTVILAQPYNPNPMAIASYYRCLAGGKQGEPLDPVKMGYRVETISDGKRAFEVRVITMLDERLQPIYEHQRWAEMYQAAHRVRPACHKRHIVILGNVLLKGLPPTEVIHRPFKRGRPSCYPAIKEATEKLLEAGDTVTRDKIACTANVSLGAVKKYWKQLANELELHIVRVRIPRKGYPNGRRTEALCRDRS